MHSRAVAGRWKEWGWSPKFGVPCVKGFSMRRSLSLVGALLVMSGGMARSGANPYVPINPCPVPPAPYAMGYYPPSAYGPMAFPNPNCPLPPFPPFNGPMYAPRQCQQNVVPDAQFPTHPYARSPRDFFMVPTP